MRAWCAHRTIWVLPAAGEGLFCASSDLGANAPLDQARGDAVGSWRCVWGLHRWALRAVVELSQG